MSGLDRFVTAQEPVLASVAAELQAGAKRSHWMWFIFPQIIGLGHSSTAQLYALRNVEEARRYLAHPMLGERLRAHVRLLLAHKTKSAYAILGSPDDMKLKSCLTLFEAAATDAEDRALFGEGLAQFYGGERDARTLRIIGA